MHGKDSHWCYMTSLFCKAQCMQRESVCDTYILIAVIHYQQSYPGGTPGCAAASMNYLWLQQMMATQQVWCGNHSRLFKRLIMLKYVSCCSFICRCCLVHVTMCLQMYFLYLFFLWLWLIAALEDRLSYTIFYSQQIQKCLHLPWMQSFKKARKRKWYKKWRR